jgi:hypothetical protein
MRVCDLHKESVQAAKTVRFSWDGARHQLDLCTEHLGEVESTVNGWLRGSSPSNGTRRKARRSAGASAGRAAAKRRPSKRTSAETNPSGELRAWAKANGYSVSDRGRIPSQVRTAYEAASK